MTSLMAAMRDCSFDDKPRRSRIGVVFHALVERNGRLEPACGCGPHIKGNEEPASGLLETEKCRASGCRQAFDRAKDGAAGG